MDGLRGPAAASKKGPSPNVNQNIKDCKEIQNSLETGKEDSEQQLRVALPR